MLSEGLVAEYVGRICVRGTINSAQKHLGTICSNYFKGVRFRIYCLRVLINLLFTGKKKKQ